MEFSNFLNKTESDGNDRLTAPLYPREVDGSVSVAKVLPDAPTGTEQQLGGSSEGWTTLV